MWSFLSGTWSLKISSLTTKWVYWQWSISTKTVGTLMLKEDNKKIYAKLYFGAALLFPALDCPKLFWMAKMKENLSLTFILFLLVSHFSSKHFRCYFFFLLTRDHHQTVAPFLPFILPHITLVFLFELDRHTTSCPVASGIECTRLDSLVQMIAT